MIEARSSEIVKRGCVSSDKKNSFGSESSNLRIQVERSDSNFLELFHDNDEDNFLVLCSDIQKISCVLYKV